MKKPDPLQEEANNLAHSILSEFQRKDLDICVCISAVCLMFETFCEMNIKKGPMNLSDVHQLLEAMYTDIQRRIRD